MIGSQGRRAAAALAVAAALALAPTAAGAAEPEAAAVTPPSREDGAYTARIVAASAARARPGAGRTITRLKPATEWSGAPQVLLVLDAARVGGREWLRVLLPIRPNGVAGWIPRSRVSLGHDRVWIEIQKGSRRLLAYRNGRLVKRYRVVIGAAATPTPSGLAAIYERNRQPEAHGFLGPWALPLTALSPVLRNFGGGPGRVAIHGRDGASFADPLGSAASHGCIRIPNAGIRWLAAHAPPGTPVEIVK